MRALFLLLATLLMTGCSGELRTHPVTRSTSPTPQPITPSEEPIVAIEKELSAADFSRLSPQSLTWQKGTENGGIIVTLSPENEVTATVKYKRPDGDVLCKPEGPRMLLVSQIQRWDLVPSAAQLVAKYGCTPAK